MALFMSTVDSLDPSGCSYNPTKSLCSPSVFNTAITRAKSLIVAVGNPYTLMTVEENMGTDKQCWAEYLSCCFKTNTVVARNGVSDDVALQELRCFVGQRVQLHVQSAPVEQHVTLMTPVKQTKQSVIHPSSLQEKHTEHHLKELQQKGKKNNINLIILLSRQLVDEVIQLWGYLAIKAKLSVERAI